MCKFVDFTSERSLLCGGLVSSTYGVIRSPQFPDPYLNNLDCIWLLTTSVNQLRRFLFTFNTFDVRRCCDVVQVFALLPESQWSHQLLRDGMCMDRNTSCPCSDMFSFVGYQFYLTFTTDDSVVGDGFEIAYSSVGMYTW